MKTAGVLLMALTSGFALNAQAQFSTSFEGPTYTSGLTIAGQDTWTVSAVPDNSRILNSTEISTLLGGAGLSTDNPVHSGSQALVVSGAGSSSATIRQVGGLNTENGVIIDFWARPLTGGSLGNIFLTAENAGNTRAAAVRFGATTIDYGSSAAQTFPWVPTETAWSADEWYNFRLDLDYSSRTYDFSINGSQINQDPIPFYDVNSDSFDHIRVFRGSNQAGMILDDLTIVAVPEPSTLAFFALGAAALLFRRKA